MITHDACHATNYLGTLRAILDHDRSWQLAAQVLHIHKQTLGYRIRKIGQLTGRGITRTEHLAEGGSPCAPTISSTAASPRAENFPRALANLSGAGRNR